jgi:hypothetical protein
VDELAKKLKMSLDDIILQLSHEVKVDVGNVDAENSQMDACDEDVEEEDEQWQLRLPTQDMCQTLKKKMMVRVKEARKQRVPM